MESLNPLADLAGGASEANHIGLRLSEGGGDNEVQEVSLTETGVFLFWGS